MKFAQRPAIIYVEIRQATNARCAIILFQVTIFSTRRPNLQPVAIYNAEFSASSCGSTTDQKRPHISTIAQSTTQDWIMNVGQARLKLIGRCNANAQYHDQGVSLLNELREELSVAHLIIVGKE